MTSSNCDDLGQEAPGPGSYVYTPLSDAHSIRLVLLYSAPDPATPLKCTITTRPLPDGVPFEALSYQWGNPDKTHTMFCDGVPLEITMSLYKALISLRSKDTDRVLWAEAVCIHQDDLVEKSTQVSYMAEIYKTAKRTVVYLGEPFNDTAPAMDSIKEIATMCLEASGERLDNINRIVDDDIYTLICKVRHTPLAGTCMSKKGVLKALRTFFDYGWWDRIWVEFKFNRTIYVSIC